MKPRKPRTYVRYTPRYVAEYAQQALAVAQGIGGFNDPTRINMAPEDYKRAAATELARMRKLFVDLEPVGARWLQDQYDDRDLWNAAFRGTPVARFTGHIKNLYEQHFGRLTNLPRGVVPVADLSRWFNLFEFNTQIQDYIPIAPDRLPPTPNYHRALAACFGHILDKQHVHEPHQDRSNRYQFYKLCAETINRAFAEHTGAGYPGRALLMRVGKKIAARAQKAQVDPVVFCQLHDVDSTTWAAVTGELKALEMMRYDGTDLDKAGMARDILARLAALRIDYLAGQDTWALGVFVNDAFTGVIGAVYTSDRFGNDVAGDTVYIRNGAASPSDRSDQRPLIVDDRYLDLLRGEAATLIPDGATLVAIPATAWNQHMMLAAMGDYTMDGMTEEEVLYPETDMVTEGV